MLNYNGDLISYQEFTITHDNRGFKYGDSIFETIKVINGKLIFWEDHYFRLMASMRMLRMKIPIEFTLEYLESEIIKTIQKNDHHSSVRVRLDITRKDGGFYTPKTNRVDYLIQVQDITTTPKTSYCIDLFKDFYIYSGHLSTIKSNNKLLQTLASIYAEENELDNVVLLNERKGVVEATNGNIFLIKGTSIKTPSLSEGCLKGIIRGKLIQILSNHPELTIEECVISPFEIQKADEVFITSSIIGIQSVTKYRKKVFSVEITKKIAARLKIKEVTDK